MDWRSLRTASLLFLIAAGLLAAPMTALAQPDEETVAEAVTEAGEGDALHSEPHDTTLIGLFHEGGPVMWFLLAASILVVTFTIEGFVRLRNKKLAPPALQAKLEELISSGSYQQAWQTCKENKCFLANVMAAGLERIGHGKDAVDFAVQETSVREGTQLKANSQYLSVIGVVAPMIGLTGTVIGMISAFRVLGQSGISDPSALSAAIGEVLVATASGLIVAIPAFVFFYVFKNFALTAILYAESNAYRLLDEIPYEQIGGIRIGENFSAAPASAGGGAAPSRSAKVSQDVRTAAQTSSAAQTMDYQTWLTQLQQLNPQFQIDGRDPDLRAVYDSGMTPQEVQFEG